MRRACLIAICAGCGGGPPEAESPPSDGGLLSTTIVGDHQCSTDGDPRPFVVEWDATDLTTFEAQARRDVVLVRFEGCSLTPLYGCKDDGLAGRIGRYEHPQWTSGGFESLEIENLDDLYSRLPLGVASFGGRVKRGESLKMSYFVSGVVTASRDVLYAQDVQRVAEACSRATHFVHSYNLGAFSLAQLTEDGTSLEASAMGAEAGGSTSSKKKSLRRGGDLQSCETESQRDCRVPIRLTLRALNDGAPPAPVAAPPTEPNAIGAPPPTTISSDDPPWKQAWDLRTAASEKLRLKDGQACLDLLNRADKLDPEGARKKNNLRSMCLMRADRCAEGRKLYRDVLIGENTDHSKTETMIDFEVQERVDALCRIEDKSYLEQLRARITELKTKDPDRCSKGAAHVAKLIPHVKQFEKFGPGKRDAAHALIGAARCLADAGRCTEAKKWHTLARKHDDQHTVGGFDIVAKNCAP